MPDWDWSYSKSKLLKECPRAFQFSLSQGGTPRGPPATNLRSLQGTAIHEGIAFHIGQWSRGEHQPTEEAVQFADGFLKNSWDRRAKSIIEVQNGALVSSDRFEMIRRRVRGDLRDFFRMLWPRFEYCTYDTHELRQYVEVSGARIAVQVDFSCWSPKGEFYIVDWKTGGDSNQRAGGSQLAVYSLWAHRTRGVALELIRPMVVSTRTGEVVRYRATPLDLEVVQLTVDEDRHEVDAYENSGSFPATPEPAKCAGCRHLQKCDEGRRAIAEAALE